MPDTRMIEVSADLPPAWSDLLDGLALLSRGQNNRVSPLNCEHDQLFVMADPAQFTEEELRRLEDIGFRTDDEVFGFMSWRFGSA